MLRTLDDLRAGNALLAARVDELHAIALAANAEAVRARTVPLVSCARRVRAARAESALRDWARAARQLATRADARAAILARLLSRAALPPPWSLWQWRVCSEALGSAARALAAARGEALERLARGLATGRLTYACATWRRATSAMGGAGVRASLPGSAHTSPRPRTAASGAGLRGRAPLEGRNLTGALVGQAPLFHLSDDGSDNGSGGSRNGSWSEGMRGSGGSEGGRGSGGWGAQPMGETDEAQALRATAVLRRHAQATKLSARAFRAWAALTRLRLAAQERAAVSAPVRLPLPLRLPSCCPGRALFRAPSCRSRRSVPARMLAPCECAPPLASAAHHRAAQRTASARRPPPRGPRHAAPASPQAAELKAAVYALYELCVQLQAEAAQRNEGGEGGRERAAGMQAARAATPPRSAEGRLAAEAAARGPSAQEAAVRRLAAVALHGRQRSGSACSGASRSRSGSAVLEGREPEASTPAAATAARPSSRPAQTSGYAQPSPFPLPPPRATEPRSRSAVFGRLSSAERSPTAGSESGKQHAGSARRGDVRDGRYASSGAPGYMSFHTSSTAHLRPGGIAEGAALIPSHDASQCGSPSPILLS